LGTLEQLVTYTGAGQIRSADVLAVLGVTDSEQLFDAVEAIAARDPARALRVAADLARSGRDPGQVLRDLEAHSRDLLVVQVLDEVPAELRLYPERDQRLRAQAAALSRTDAVRLLDLIAAALEATANGAQARIQLELVLAKAAAPEVDPSVAALMSRIERLEGAVASAPPAIDVAPVPQPEPAPEPEPAPAASPEPPTNGTHDVDSAARAWPAVVDLIRADNAMLAALLEQARPVAVTEQELTLAFPDGAAFLKRKAEQEDHRRATVDALRAVTGNRLALRYELRELTVPGEGSSQDVLTGEELVQRFLEEFDAEEIIEEESH
jgi:DNA polymerase-3 subunit gamma/tau